MNILYSKNQCLYHIQAGVKVLNKQVQIKFVTGGNFICDKSGSKNGFFNIK